MSSSYYEVQAEVETEEGEMVTCLEADKNTVDPNTTITSRKAEEGGIVTTADADLNTFDSCTTTKEEKVRKKEVDRFLARVSNHAMGRDMPNNHIVCQMVEWVREHLRYRPGRAINASGLEKCYLKTISKEERPRFPLIILNYALTLALPKTKICYLKSRDSETKNIPVFFANVIPQNDSP